MQRKRLSSSAAAVISGNDDILTEILVLLPAKSLVRFRGVSKQLRSLIDNESFHHRHHVNRDRRRPQHQFILRTTEKPHKTFICDVTAKTFFHLRLGSEVKSERGLGSYRHVRVLQSSHGLLLLECRRFPRAEIDIYAYNPMTAKGTAVVRHLPRDDYSRFCLIYDPSKSNDYTVFRFIAHRTFGVVDVYDSRTRKWEMSTGKYGQTLKGFPQGVLCNGRLYFIRSHSPSMCFSLENLQFSAVPNPPICPPGQKKYAVESNGHLHYLVFSLSRLDVYELIDDERWVESWRVDSGGQLRRAMLGVWNIEVLGFVRGERVEDSILVYQVLGKIMVYRFCNRVSEEIVGLTYGHDQVRLLFNFGFKNSHQLSGSFASV